MGRCPRNQHRACGISIGRADKVNLNSANSIDIGYRATANGANSIVINSGGSLTTTNNAANTIILNANPAALAGATASAFYMAPVRALVTSTPVLVYNKHRGGRNHMTWLRLHSSPCLLVLQHHYPHPPTDNTSSRRYKANIRSLTPEEV